MANAGKKFLNWYPGHMYKSLQAMMSKLNRVDCVVEVHDARIPFSGRNHDLKRLLGTIKPHILVLNKRDLANLKELPRLREKLHEQGDKNVLLTDLTGTEFSFHQRGYPKLAQLIVNSIQSSDRNNLRDSLEYSIMIVGVPNVGKSMLINRLRQHHAGLAGEPAITGAQAGVTRHVMQRIKICTRPPIYVLDTPGVLMPSQTASRDETMKLALCAAISDRVVNNLELSCYLFEYLNSRQNFSYLVRMNLDKPVENHDDFLIQSALKLNLIKTTRDPATKTEMILPDVDRVISHFIKGFRNGLYGTMMLDEF